MSTLKTLSADIQVEPLDQWPQGYKRTPEENRQPSRFEEKNILDRTLTDLDTELRQLSPDLAILQVDINPNAIRRDGLPYKNAKMGDHDPGVVLTLEMPDGEVQTYPCDTFRGWAENFRAITLALGDLRRISRYGVGEGSEQYSGFTALPENVDERLGPEEAARILISTAGHRSADDFNQRVEAVKSNPATARQYLREAQANAHPDKQGGTQAHFKRVQTAADVLRQHHERRELAS